MDKVLFVSIVIQRDYAPAGRYMLLRRREELYLHQVNKANNLWRSRVRSCFVKLLKDGCLTFIPYERSDKRDPFVAPKDLAGA